MKSVISPLAVILCLISGVKYASSIFCYDCNSAFDPRCGEEFDPFSLGVVNCSLRDPPDHIDVTEPTICRSIKMEIYGKVRVVRQCGYITDAPGQKSCQRKPSNGDIFVTYCACDSDLCNAATATAHGPVMLVLSAVLCLVTY